MKRFLQLFSFLPILFLLIWSVAAQEDEHGDAVDETALIERGQTVFTINGCTACHGQNAEGTSIAPALAGHTEFAIRRQVRAPIGIMLVFSPEMISADDLSALVAYIKSLEMPMEMEGMDMGGEHAHQGVTSGDIVFTHHWLLWLALENGDTETALHQISHILPLIEASHLAKMQELQADLTNDALDAALETSEAMIRDVDVFGEDAEFVYLQMIYRALLAEDSEVAGYFIADYADHKASTDLEPLLDELSTLLADEDFEAAASLLEAEYGDSLLFEAHADDEHNEHEDSHEAEAEATEMNNGGGHSGH